MIWESVVRVAWFWEIITIDKNSIVIHSYHNVINAYLVKYYHCISSNFVDVGG